MLYYFLTGSPPNGSSAEEIARVHDREHGRKTPPSARKARPGIDRDLDWICSRAMAPEMADRYATADALARDLEDWLERRPIRGAKPTPARRLHLLVRRRPAMTLLIVTLALSGVVILASIGWAWQARQQAKNEAQQLALDMAQQEIDAIKARTQNIIEQFWGLISQGAMFDDSLPLLIWIDRLIDGPMTDPEARRDFLKNEVATLRRVVELDRAQNNTRSLKALVYESAFLIALIRAGEAQEAADVYASILPRWEALGLDPSDSHMLVIHALGACSQVLLAAEGKADRDKALAAIKVSAKELEEANAALNVRNLVAKCEQRLTDENQPDSTEDTPPPS
jgi:hypothetical protein